MSRAGADGLGKPIGGVRVPTGYTPTVTWPGNTITTQSGLFLKEPGKLLLWVSFVESAGTANAALTITLPTGFTAASMAGGLSINVGWIGFATSGQGLPVFVAPAASVSIATTAFAGVVATWSGTFVIPTLT